MSNNPFLRNKDNNNNNNNNRFNILNDDPVVNVNDRKHFNEEKSRNRSRDNYNSKRIDDNRFKSLIPEKPKLDVDNIKAFPTLVNSKERDTNIQTSSNFKDILNNVIEEDRIENTDIILPGWLQLTMLNGKVLKKEENNETEVIDEEQKELNYTMYRIGKSLQNNYEIYEKEYDSINGEGSYDKKFRLSPVYGSEYDSNSESEENNDEYDNDNEYEYEI